MNKLTKGYCDKRIQEEALANTKKAWTEEDRFYQSVIEPLNGKLIGGDKDRTVGNFSTDPDFLIDNLYIEYQTTDKPLKQLSFKKHKILNFQKYQHYIIIQRIQEKYLVIDSKEGLTETTLYWCGGKPGYLLDSSRFSNIPRLTESELTNVIQERLKRHKETKTQDHS